MIKVENIETWGFEHAIRGMELEWCTYSDNTFHSFKNGLQKFVGNQYGRFEVKKYDKSGPR